MLLVRGGTVVNAGRSVAADVLLDGRTIVGSARTSTPPGCEVIEAGGSLVIPGGIDPHTHLDLPVGTVRSADDFESGTVAAACGGTTTIIDFAGARRERPDEALVTWHESADG